MTNPRDDIRPLIEEVGDFVDEHIAPIPDTDTEVRLTALLWTLGFAAALAGPPPRPAP